MDVLSLDQVISRLRSQSQYAQGKYLAMYSTWLGGITTEPALMMVPIDDHLVHRGDGVFEAFRSRRGKILELEGHLLRLQNSAQAIGLKLPYQASEIQKICQDLLSFAKGQDALFRLYVSRGPGGFTTNPYECVASQLYIVLTQFVPPPKAKYQEGASAQVSEVLAKPPPYSQIKSCNYLPNVLMKKEAVDRGVDYTICMTEEGAVAEGSTENLLMVSREGDLLAPPFDYTLRGTTLLRVLEIGKTHVGGAAGIGKVELRPIRREDLSRAREIMMVGTTIGLLPVTTWEGCRVGSGLPGPVFQLLSNDLKHIYGDE